jgi:hypothetical protein
MSNAAQFASFIPVDNGEDHAHRHGADGRYGDDRNG